MDAFGGGFWALLISECLVAGDLSAGVFVSVGESSKKCAKQLLLQLAWWLK